MQGHKWNTIVRKVTTGADGNERFSRLVLSLVVLAGILSVALTDRTVGQSVSLASLYLLPLALSALVHRLRVSLVLSIACLLMHHVVESSSNFAPRHLIRDIVTLAGYIFVVVIVNQLGGQRRRLAEAAREQRDELAGEIQLAAEVQQGILPRTVPSIPGIDIAVKMHPAKIVAGDYYGFFNLAEGNVALVVADVSGKGVAAGLLMPSIEIALRLDSPRHAFSNQLIKAFNDVVCQVTHGKRFISLFYGKLSPASRKFEYTNAGHNPPLLVRKGCPSRLLSSGGPVLGVIPHAEYEHDIVELIQGDLLILYTDGLVEAENPQGEAYSVQRLEAAAIAHLDESAENIAEAIYEAVIHFREKSTLDDDATLLLVKVL